MSRLLGLVIIGVLVVFSGCKKDEPLTPVQLLAGTNSSGKSWTLVEQSINGVVSEIGSCAADDLTTFYPNLDFLFDEGNSKCNASDPQNLNGTWVLDQNDTHLLITQGSDVFDYEVIILNESILTLKTQILGLEVVTTFYPQ